MTLACGLPSPSAEPTAPQADSILPTPSAEPEPPLPVSLSQAASAGVEAGLWTEAEGIIRSLCYLTGELSAEAITGDRPSGGPIPLHPREGEGRSFGAGPGAAHFTLDPLVLHRYRLSFADHTRFTVRLQAEGVNRNAARPASAPGAWSEMPPEINTECGDSEYVLLGTSVVPPGAGEATINLATRGERVEGDQPCDECVVGTWQLDNTSYLAHLGGLWPVVQAGLEGFGLHSEGVEVHPTGVFGVMTMTFDGSGVAKGEQIDWGFAGKGVRDDDVVTIQLVYNGAGEATWRIETDETTDTDYLFFDDRTFALSGRMIFQGFPLSAPLPTSSGNDPIFLSSPQPFLCNATTLTYYAEDPLGPVVFVRGAPVSSEP